MREQFIFPAKMKKVSLVLLAIGILSLILGIIVLNDKEGAIRFWTVILFNCIFFLLGSLTVVFLLGAATLAQGSWHIAYRRVMEAIMMALPVIGGITFIVFMIIVWGDKSYIYAWADKNLVAHNHLLQIKKPFLNPIFFTILSAITIGVWSLLCYRLRRLSILEDAAPKGSTKLFWRTMFVSAVFIVVYAASNSSSSWQWIMSLTPDWYSTLFAWYIFASSFITGITILTLFVIAVHHFGFMEWITHEHIHDMGKLMFAFSIFWCYLWFAQYMLIWYGNIPEETTYFQSRLWGSFRPLFLLNIIINFVAPFLILMTRDSKRSYTNVVFMAILLFIGHYNDFFLMFIPSTEKGVWHLSWYEFGITLGFVGLMIWLVGKNLERASLYPKHHPFLKETIIHHS